MYLTTEPCSSSDESLDFHGVAAHAAAAAAAAAGIGHDEAILPVRRSSGGQYVLLATVKEFSASLRVNRACQPASRILGDWKRSIAVSLLGEREGGREGAKNRI